jgi:ParB family chromosome partitioning protein
MTRKRGLGKGLGALLGEYVDPQVSEDTEVRRLLLANIVPNPLQPRRVFTDDELEELATSIQANGLLQPLVVRPAPGAEDRYELIAGERRFRAMGRLGWDDTPALVREASDETLLVLALVENLQRQALNPLEEAEGYQALMDQFELTQAEVATSVGKNRSTVANFLRILRLPPSIKKLLADQSLSTGHARALLMVDDPVRQGELARGAVAEGWSVREMERRVGQSPSGKARSTKKSAKPRDPMVKALEEALQEHLSTRVTIRRGRKNKGSIEIVFHGDEDFERIFQLIADRDVSEAVG